MEILSPFFAISLPGGAEILILLCVLAYLFIWIKSIVEIARSKFTDSTQQVIWLLVVILCGVIGLILYYAIGRKNRVHSSEIGP